MRGTVALNGEVGTYYPRIMKACADLKWELMGHGLTNSVMLTGMSDREVSSTPLNFAAFWRTSIQAGE